MIPFAHRLWFVRHGETDYNRDGRLQGQKDIPLNPKGREQAGAIGRALRKLVGPEMDRLERDRAFLASPLVRTRETMTRARAGLGLAPDDYDLSDALKELTFGDWEGLTWPEVEARAPAEAAARAADKWDFVPPNGESYALLAKRIAPWLASVERDLFIVSHGGVARALMHRIAGVRPAVASDVAIHQGRAILFADGAFRWIG